MRGNLHVYILCPYNINTNMLSGEGRVHSFLHFKRYMILHGDQAFSSHNVRIGLQLDLLGNHSLCVCGCLFPADLFIYFLDYTVCDGG